MRNALESHSRHDISRLYENNPGHGPNMRTWPGGDSECGDDRVSHLTRAGAAAKVSRDRVMYEADRLYPEYGFANHKGYPTAVHREAVMKYGPSPIHRLSFLRNIPYGK